MYTKPTVERFGTVRELTLGTSTVLDICIGTPVGKNGCIEAS
jgi:hypothetical protein